MFDSIEDVQRGLEAADYVADRRLATALFLALRLRKPLLLEGEAGVGKTEVAKVLAGMLGTRLLRLQGYEGIDVSQAVYEWNYAHQIMAIRMAEGTEVDGARPDVFGPQFLIKRPLLQSLEGHGGKPTVLLLDELDRVDEEFEAFLLEFLSDFQVSIPELGTISADSIPVVIITSNRTRELHDALKRRCLYHWIDYPTSEKEYEILTRRLPGASERLRRQVASLVQSLRGLNLYKAPGVAESLDWVAALDSLGQDAITPSVADETIGVLLKNQEDIDRARGTLGKELAEHAG